MKKKVLFIVLLVSIFTLTGCGSTKLKTDKDLNNYLKETYPGEQFEIISKEKITINGANTGGCDEVSEGLSYKIKSLDTDITFSVEDEYYFNSFTCAYKITNDYLEIAEKKFIEENSIYKVDTYYHCYKCLGIKFEKENYSSKEEMKESVNIVIEKLKTTYPFKHESIRKNADISIDSKENINDLVNIDDLDTETINQLIDNLY